MDVRLVQLLASFIAARSHYALARLEFALRHAADPAPPVIDVLAEPSKRALHERWPHLERQLETALAYAGTLQRTQRISKDHSYRRLQQTLRELDQYSRAIRWVLTVTTRDEDGGVSSSM